MRRRSVLIAIIMCLGTFAPLAAETSDGVISGKIVNGSPEGGSTANLEITLETYIGSAAEPSITQGQTDADGNFTFTGLSPDATNTFLVTATYLGIKYYSLPVNFAQGETAKTTEIEVYETSESDAGLIIALSHTIIEVDTDGLSITEFFIFQNTGDRTWVGSQESQAGARITAILPMPPAASSIQLGSEVGDNAIFTDQGLVYVAPIIPGYTQITYAYRLSNVKSEYTFNRQVEYVQSIYEFLVQGAGQVESLQLTKEAPLTIEGIPYDYFSGESISAGQLVTVQISGLPQDTSRQTVLWVLLTLVVLGGAFALMLRLSRRRTSPVTEGGQEQLLVQIARLDDDFESGMIDEESYRLKRNDLKNRVIRARQQSDGRGD